MSYSGLGGFTGESSASQRIPNNKRKRTETSLAWNYFKKVTDNTAVCKLCDCSLTGDFSSGFTSRIWSHLEGHHGLSKKEVENKEVVKKKNSQPTLGSMLGMPERPSLQKQNSRPTLRSLLGTTEGPSLQKQNKLDNLLVKMVASDDIPFSEVEDGDILDLFKVLHDYNPNMTMTNFLNKMQDLLINYMNDLCNLISNFELPTSIIIDERHFSNYILT